MAIALSTALGVTPESLSAEGVFDGFIDFDSNFHIDPALLSVSRALELKDSHLLFERHFSNILRLLDHSTNPGDIFFKEATKLLVFPEIDSAALGYAASGRAGRGIGEGLARDVAHTALQIVKAGIKDPVIFELIGLFQEDIGADLVSDMTLQVILPCIIRFNRRVVKNLNLKVRDIAIGEQTCPLPVDAENRSVLLMPKDILSPLPVAYCWEDIDKVAKHNSRVRRDINQYIGNTWKQATNRQRISKRDFRNAIIKDPELLADLISQYKGKPLAPYDFDSDPVGRFIWYEAAEKFAALFPLEIKTKAHPTTEKMRETVLKICAHFGKLIESNGLFKLLYDKHRKLKPEKAAQLLFFGVADAYCRANDLDLSPECDSGRGPVDFKISSGSALRFNVELKYSTNKKLVSGYEKQLPTYNSAESAMGSVYLVIQTNRSLAPKRRLERVKEDGRAKRLFPPTIIWIDGQWSDSASLL